MIPSKNAYNQDPFSPETVLIGVSAKFRKTKEIPTTRSGTRFHYEFWLNDGELYACIHCDHAKPDPDFIKYVKDTFERIILPKMINHGYTDLKSSHLKEKSYSGNKGINTHAINLPCRRSNPEDNAALLKYLIEKSYNILTRY